MTSTIQGLWWAFLIAAAVVTLVDVYLLARVVRLARGISVLTGRTLPSAAGIAENTQVGDHLGKSAELFNALRFRGASIGKLAGLLAEQLTRKDV